MTKWKVAFFISLTATLLTIAVATYVVLNNALSTGHSKDNVIILAEDIDHISKAIRNGANTIDEFDNELQKDNAGHNTDKELNIIRLQIATITFGPDGKFDKIETNLP